MLTPRKDTGQAAEVQIENLLVATENTADTQESYWDTYSKDISVAMQPVEITNN